MTLKRLGTLAVIALTVGRGTAAMVAGSELDFGFANALLDDGDYYRAITEYERFLFEHPQDSRTADVRFRVALCYFQGQKYDTAARLLSILASNRTETAVAARAEFLLAEIQYRLGRYTEAVSRYEAYLQQHPEEPAATPARLRLSTAYLRFGNVEWAKSALRRGAVGNADDSMEARQRDVEAFRALSTKSPTLAGTLSAVLPGAGQLYDEKPTDALVAFLVNGLVIGGAAVAFHNHEPVAGGALSLFGFSWYAGNIYNAVNNAHKYNQRQLESFLNRVELKWGLLSSDGSDRLVPEVGATVRF